MKAISVYKTSDGQYFENEDKAINHQKDIIGELLDDLIPNDDRGNITRTDRFNILIKIINDKNLFNKISILQDAVEHLNDNDDDC